MGCTYIHHIHVYILWGAHVYIIGGHGVYMYTSIRETNGQTCLECLLWPGPNYSASQYSQTDTISETCFVSACLLTPCLPTTLPPFLPFSLPSSSLSLSNSLPYSLPPSLLLSLPSIVQKAHLVILQLPVVTKVLGWLCYMHTTTHAPYAIRDVLNRAIKTVFLSTSTKW